VPAVAEPNAPAAFAAKRSIELVEFADGAAPASAATEFAAAAGLGPEPGLELVPVLALLPVFVASCASPFLSQPLPRSE